MDEENDWETAPTQEQMFIRPVGNPYFSSILKKLTENCEIERSDLDYCLYSSVFQNNLSISKKLIQHGAKFSYVDNDQRSVIHMAEKKWFANV